jgi:hypothetical protein
MNIPKGEGRGKERKGSGPTDLVDRKRGMDEKRSTIGEKP